MRFDDKYFQSFHFSKEQVSDHLNNANKDLNIAKKDNIPEVKFTYAFSALIKAGLALLSHNNQKIKSVPGHHIKIIDALAQILKDESINDVGNAMRSKRNLDMYSGGVEITEKECREYLDFVDGVLNRIKTIIS
jgi:uncharacterized protein (UPF0332 family)